MTNLHKRLDTINQKLAALDKRTLEQGESLRDVRRQTSLMAQMLNVMTRMQQESHQQAQESHRTTMATLKEIQESHREISEIVQDTALLVSENLKETRLLRNGLKRKNQH